MFYGCVCVCVCVCVCGCVFLFSFAFLPVCSGYVWCAMRSDSCDVRARERVLIQQKYKMLFWSPSTPMHMPPVHCALSSVCVCACVCVCVRGMYMCARYVYVCVSHTYIYLTLTCARACQPQTLPSAQGAGEPSAHEWQCPRTLHLFPCVGGGEEGDVNSGWAFFFH